MTDDEVEASEILWEEGSWALRVALPYTGNLADLHSYIAHKCITTTYSGEDEPKMYYWWNKDIIDTPCYGCDEYPPKDVMALWKLHNFDWIQQEET